MRHKTNTRSSLFLMELIIAILFFSLASAVCLRMFAKSHQLSTDASAQNQAVNQADNVAELLKYDLEKNAHILADEYPEADLTDMYNNSVIYYDKNWNACSANQAEYKLTIQAQDSSDTLKKYVLSVSAIANNDADSQNCIYELPLSIHIAREVTAHE